jgi:hypothetical protein
MTPEQWSTECLRRMDLAGAEASPSEVVAVIVREAVAAERERSLAWVAEAISELKQRAAVLESEGNKDWAARYRAKVATAEDIQSAIRSGK